MSAALTRLLQLASPALPVGAYTYSQGLEWAVEAATVRDEAGAYGAHGGHGHSADGEGRGPRIHDHFQPK